MTQSQLTFKDWLRGVIGVSDSLEEFMTHKEVLQIKQFFDAYSDWHHSDEESYEWNSDRIINLLRKMCFMKDADNPEVLLKLERSAFEKFVDAKLKEMGNFLRDGYMDHQICTCSKSSFKLQRKRKGSRAEKIERLKIKRKSETSLSKFLVLIKFNNKMNTSSSSSEGGHDKEVPKSQEVEQDSNGQKSTFPLKKCTFDDSELPVPAPRPQRKVHDEKPPTYGSRKPSKSQNRPLSSTAAKSMPALPTNNAYVYHLNKIQEEKARIDTEKAEKAKLDQDKKDKALEDARVRREEMNKAKSRKSSLTRKSLETKPTDWKPINTEHPANADRYRVMDLVNNFDDELMQFKDPLTNDDLELLKRSVKPWKLLTGYRYSHQSMSGHTAVTENLNKRRLMIMRAIGHGPTPRLMGNLVREMQAVPNLARTAESKKRLQNLYSKTATSRPPQLPTKPRQKTATTFFGKRSGAWNTKEGANEKQSLPKPRPTSGARHSSPEAPSSPLRDDNNSEEIAANIPLYFNINLIKPPFQAKRGKCKKKHVFKYFKQLNDSIRKMNNTWVLSMAEVSTIEDSIMKIPEDMEPIFKEINDGNDLLLKDKNNNFLVDVLAGAWLESSNQVFEGPEILVKDDHSCFEKIIDLSTIMDKVSSHFMTYLQNGLSLPPLSMKGVKKVKPDKNIIRYAEVPTTLSPDNPFSDFVGEKRSDTWRVVMNTALSFEDALGFVPKNSLSLKTLELLLKKLETIQPSLSRIKNRFFPYSYIQQWRERYPTPLTLVGNPGCDIFEEIVKLRDGDVENVYIALCHEKSGIYLMTKIDIIYGSIKIFLPDGSEKPFWKWVTEGEDREDVGLDLLYIKELFEVASDERDAWCDDKSDKSLKTDKPPTGRFNDSWPWYAISATHEKIHTSSSPWISAVICAMWYEREVMGAEHPEQMIVMEQQLFPGDVRLKYLDAFNNMSL